MNLVYPPDATTRVPVAELRTDDIIHPPARELSLWMRRHAAENGWKPSALTLTVEKVEPAQRGAAWRTIVATQNDARFQSWRILAKATTLWPVVSRQGC